VVIGVAGIMAGHDQVFGPLAGVGSILSLIGMLLFAVIVFTRIRVAPAGSRSPSPIGAD
jgi:hypothetical protein